VLLRRTRRRLGADRADPAAAAALIDAVVARYRDTGLLDDGAYALMRARSRLARGEPLRRIAAGLAAKGVGREEAAAALAQLRDGAGDPDLAAACAFARRRRLGPFRHAASAPSDRQRDRQRELAVFARAGFARQIAEQVLGCTDAAAIAELLAETDA